MKRTTKKLSGVGLQRFLRRFYGKYDEIEEELADRLSEDGAKAFTSVRVRSTAWRQWQHNRKAEAQPNAQAAKAPAGTSPKAKRKAPPPQPQPAASEPPIETTKADTAAETTTAQAKENGETTFDPYAIGLVPVYQREGAEGLANKLAAIASLDNLRKMARSQQVALPAELRGNNADIDAVRAAIVSAVGKRIANRRAAAG